MDSGPLMGASPVGVISRGRRAVLFLRLPDGTTRPLQVGGSYLGWRLTALGGDAATFARSGERITIKYGSVTPVAAQQSNEEDEESDEE